MPFIGVCCHSNLQFREERALLIINIAIIDDDLNIDFFSGKVLIEKYIIKSNKIIKDDKSCSEITHSTICTKIIKDNLNCECKFIGIRIFNTILSAANINDFILALRWCAHNDIDIVHLSIGSVYLRDIDRLYEAISLLLIKNIIIIAAGDNNDMITYPASFKECLGVKCKRQNERNDNIDYIEYPYDGIDLVVPIKEKIINYKNIQIDVMNCNSFAAPYITAKVCNYVAEGFRDLKSIRDQLKKELKKAECYYNNFYFIERDIMVPIIAFVEIDQNRDSIDFLLSLLSEFKCESYYGILLSNFSITDSNKSIFNLDCLDCCSRGLYENIKIYFNLTTPDLIFLYINESEYKDLLTQISVDIVLNVYNQCINHIEYDLNQEITNYYFTTNSIKEIYLLLRNLLC